MLQLVQSHACSDCMVLKRWGEIFNMRYSVQKWHCRKYCRTIKNSVSGTQPQSHVNFLYTISIKKHARVWEAWDRGQLNTAHVVTALCAEGRQGEYSRNSLINLKTPLAHMRASLLVRCPDFGGCSIYKGVWDAQMCPVYRGVLISGRPDQRGSTVVTLPDLSTDFCM